MEDPWELNNGREMEIACARKTIREGKRRRGMENENERVTQWLSYTSIRGVKGRKQREEKKKKRDDEEEEQEKMKMGQEQNVVSSVASGRSQPSAGSRQTLSGTKRTVIENKVE